MKISFQKLFFVIATVFALFAILVLAKSILIPLSVSLLMSFILFPLAKKLESWGMNKILAAFLSIFGVILIIGGVIFFFSTQIIELSKEVSHFQDKIINAFADVTVYVNNNMSFVENLQKNVLFDRMKGWLAESSGSLISKTVSNAATFLAGLLAIIIFTFLFLIYRDGLTKALVRFSTEDKSERLVKMFKSVQQVGQKYFLGMLFITILIGLVNSIGLWIIGIENPILFGFLGATLSIIPYIGTTFGAIIPVTYAFVSHDSGWMAIAVGLLFWGVQMITDNFLTPKIVGNSLKVNALTTILSLIIGAAVWGVAGMILFLPFVAMFKVVCEEYEELKPVALLIGNQNYQEKGGSGKFISKWFEKIKSYFSKLYIAFKKK